MNDTITRLLSEALAAALKDALVPIVREAVTEALKSVPQTETTLPEGLEDRLTSIEASLEDKVDSSDIEDAVSSAVSDCLDSGSWDITFRS